jgi:vacuolar-type H+-ATPase subunit I/STV1
MPTFVDEIQSVAPGDAPTLRRQIADRVEAVSDAVGVLESWTEESDETRAELASKYDTAKSLARDEIREAADTDAAAEADDADALAPEDLLTHPAVSEKTKRLLSEYSTRLHAFLDEERSYGEAREELRTALADELSLYQDLLDGLGTGAAVQDAQAAIARFAREETPGPPNQTATDVLLESTVAEDTETS